MQPHPTRHYKRPGLEGPTTPFLLFEVRLRFDDVRSDYRHSETACYITPWNDSLEVVWARDMVQPVSMDELVEFAPPQPCSWPATADEQIVRYFTTSVRKSILRNYQLHIYADSSESRDDFVKRCEAEISDERRTELVKVRDVYLRRFLDLEQRYAAELSNSDWAGGSLDAKGVQIRSVFRGIREQFSRCFLREHLSPLLPDDLVVGEVGDVEFSERLEEIRVEFLTAYNALSERFRSQVMALESYDVPLNHSQVELMARAILWEE